MWEPWQETSERPTGLRLEIHAWMLPYEYYICKGAKCYIGYAYPFPKMPFALNPDRAAV
jgi:hypothetical protein